MSQINSKFFSLTKEKSPSTIDKIKEVLQSIKINKPLHELKIYNRSLLFWASIFENESLVDNLLKTKEFNKKEEIIPILQIIIPNKNPIVLNRIITNLNNTDEENKELAIDIYEKVSLNCYRDENINIMVNFLHQYLNEENKIKFIAKCFENNNIPILKQINSDIKWHQYIVNHIKDNIELIKNSTHYLTYNSLLNEQAKDKEYKSIENNSDFSILPIQSNLEMNSDNSANNIVIPTIIKKKRKIVG